jgi:CrcB protein
MEFAGTVPQLAGLMTPTIFSSEENSFVQAYLWVCLGAIAGSSARFFLSRLAARLLSTAFPYGTLFINISGSFLVGLFLIWTSERVLVDPRWRLLVAIGFCGSYTTFSSYAFESIAYLEQGHWLLFGSNIFANNVLCLAAVVAGAALARAL